MARIKFKTKTAFMLPWTVFLLVLTTSAEGFFTTPFPMNPSMPTLPTPTTPYMGYDYGTHCPTGTVFCMAAKRCVDVEDGSCNNGGGDDNTGDEGTTCEHDETFCFSRRKCVKKDGSCDNGGGSDPVDEGTTCGHDEMYCFTRRKCVKINGPCDNGGGGGSNPEDNSSICGHDEMFCFTRKKCVKIEGPCDNGGGGGGNPDANSSMCGHDEMFCFARKKCVKIEGPCDNGGGGGGNPEDNSSMCGHDEMFCFARKKCVKIEGPCDNGGGGGGIPDDNSSMCGHDEMFCFARKKCVKIEGPCDNGGGGGGNPDDNGSTCGHDEMYCFARKKCVKIDGTCDNGGGGGGNHNDQGAKCEPGEMFCFTRKKCVKIEGPCDNGGGGGGGGGGYPSDNGVQCAHDETFCMATRQCVKCNEDKGGGDGEDPVGVSKTCAGDEMFCFTRKKCVKIEGPCDNGGGGGGGGGGYPSDNGVQCAHDETFCMATRQCVKCNEDKGGGEGEDPVGVSKTCAGDEMFCFTRKKCVKIEGPCDNGGGGGGGGGGGYPDNNGVQCAHDETFCMTTRQCVKCSEDNGGGGGEDPVGVFKTCAVDEVFCFVRKMCVSAKCFEDPCEKSELIGWIDQRYELEGCYDRCNGSDFVCVENGRLKCVEEVDQCSYIRVSLAFYTGMPHEAFVTYTQDVLTQFSEATLINTNQMWMVESWADPENEGYTRVAFNVPLEETALVEAAFNTQQPLTIIVEGDLAVDMDWTLSGMAQVPIQEVIYTRYLFRIPLAIDGIPFGYAWHHARDLANDVMTLQPEVTDVGFIVHGSRTDKITVYAEYTSATILEAELADEKLDSVATDVVTTVLNQAYFPVGACAVDETDTASVTLLNDDPSVTVYALPTPVGQNEPMEFNMESIVPDSDIPYIPNQVVLDCSGTLGVTVKAGDQLFNGAIEISDFKTTTITVQHTLSEHSFVKCQVTEIPTDGESDEHHFIGFLAIPDNVGDISEIQAVDTLVFNEDSAMIEVPENILSPTFHGSDLADDLASGALINQLTDDICMVCNIADKQGYNPMSPLALEALAFQIHTSMNDSMNNLRATVSIGDDSLVEATLYYKGEPLQNTRPIPVLPHLSDMTIQAQENYNGEFSIQFQAYEGDLSFELTVEVVNIPDDPVRKDVDLSQGSNYFTYDGSVETAPAFPVKDIAGIAFSDADGDNLGMFLYGSVQSVDTVPGQWEVSIDAGVSWEAVDAVSTVSEDGTLAARALHADAQIRFMSSSETPDAWTIVRAPSIAFSPFDHQPSEDIVEVPVTQCSSVKKGVEKYCTTSDSGPVGDMVLLRLGSLGCDNIFNSGNVQEACGCGDSDSCLDCAGIPDGGAKLDVCTVCDGGFVEIDCYDPTCYAGIPGVCNIILGQVNDCAVGTRLNEYHPGCEAKCIDDGASVLDRCDVPCGNNDCVDCNDVVNGDHDLNLCGECKLISELNVDCSTIGRIQPSNALKGHVHNINVTYTSALLISPETCVLALAEVASEDDIETTVVSETVNVEDSTTTITLEPVGNNFAAGGYYITCGDWSTSMSSQMLTVYNSPVLTSISPVENSLTSLKEDADSYWATVTGSGFEDTGYFICLASCEQLGLSCGSFRGAPGIRLDSNTGQCPVGLLSNFEKGQTYNAYISLEASPPGATEWDASMLSNSVQFTVTVSGPQPDSAELSRDGCYKMTVKFDKDIAIATDNVTKCSNYMDIGDDAATCTVASDTLVVTYTQYIAPGTSINFVDNKIYSAIDLSGSHSFMNGGTVVATLNNPKTPSASIGEASNEVGCDGAFLKAKLKKKGCWDYTMTWSDQSDLGLISTPEESRKIRIQYDDMDDGVTYTVGMEYKFTTPNGEIFSTGSETIHLTKTAEDYNLVIHGQTEEVDTTETNEYRAVVTRCGTSADEIEVNWYLDDELISTSPRIAFMANTLNAANTYNLRCEVTVNGDNGGTLEHSLTFTTEDRVLDAGVYLDGQEQYFFEVAPGDTLQLTGADKNGYTGATYMWMCAPDHTNSAVPPCVVIEGDTVSTWIATGESVTIPAAQHIVNNDLVNPARVLQLIIADGTSNATAQFTIETKEPSESDQDLNVPEIFVKDTVSSDRNNPSDVGKKGKVNMKVKVRYASLYTWLNASSAYSDIDISPINIAEATIQKGEEQAYIDYKKKKTNCNLKLRLDIDKMEEGRVYTITFTAFNDQHKSLHTFYVFRPATQTPGDVDVVSVDETQNEFKVIMTDWSNEDTFSCYASYQPTSSDTGTPINALATSPAVGIDSFIIDLAGEYVVKVECCDDYTCVSATASTNIVVTSPVDVIDLIENTVPFLVQTADDTLISMLLPSIFNSFGTLDTTSYSSTEIGSVTEILYDATNIAIMTTLSLSFTSDSAATSLKLSVALVIQCGDNIDGTTTSYMQGVATTLLEEATSGYSLEKRRKRSTTTSESPSGVSEQEATTYLTTYELSYKADEAETFINAIGDIMLGMAMQFEDSYLPWKALANSSYIQVYGTNLTGYDTLAYNVIPDDYSSTEITPVRIVLGADIASMYEYEWECTIFDNCTHIYLSTAILAFDPYSAMVGVTPPTRMSDILVTYLINPESYAAESISDLTNQVEVTFVLEGTVDMDEYDYKCFMFESGGWDEELCSADTPQLDSSQYTVKCSCTSLGIVAVFQDTKPEFTTTTVATTVSTTPPTTTTPLPSVVIAVTTDYVLVSFTFYDDFYTFVAVVNDFFDVIRAAITDNTFITSGHISNHAVVPGSIIVSFELHESGSGYTLGEMVYILQEMVTSGNITFTSPNGTILTLDPSSFTYTQERYTSGGSDSDEGSSNVGVIVGAVIASVVIVGLIIAVVILVLKQKGIIKIGNNSHSSNTSSVPDHPPPRYEIARSTYVMAAPPPYLYENPLKVSEADKWIEDEVEKKVAEIINSRDCKDEPRPSSSERCQSAGLVTLRNEKNDLPSVS